MKILFVCSSNVCRSPYCEYVFKRMVKDNPILLDYIEDIKSSAVLNLSYVIHPKTKKALINNGFDELDVDAHKPSYLWTHTKRFDNADIIIGMSKTNKYFLPKRYRNKFTTLSEIATGKYTRIKDPFLITNEKKYNSVLNEISGYLDLYANKLIKQKQKADL